MTLTIDLEVIRRAKTMKTLPDHRPDDVDSLSDLCLFNLPRAAGRMSMSMAALLHHCSRFICYHDMYASINTLVYLYAHRL